MATKTPEDNLKNILKNLKLNEDTISTILGAVVVVVVGLLVFNYFRSINEPGEITEVAESETVVPGQPELVEENGVTVPKGLPTIYTVAAGDDLWHIAESYYNSGYNWVDIAEANQLTDANQIETGQKLTIPKVEVKAATVEHSDTTMVTDTKTINGPTYTVEKGDFLWDIAVRAYGDGYQWTAIYEANIDTIGANPSLIEVGQTLSIPR